MLRVVVCLAVVCAGVVRGQENVIPFTMKDSGRFQVERFFFEEEATYTLEWTVTQPGKFRYVEHWVDSIAVVGWTEYFCGQPFIDESTCEVCPGVYRFSFYVFAQGEFDAFLDFDADCNILCPCQEPPPPCPECPVCEKCPEPPPPCPEPPPPPVAPPVRLAGDSNGDGAVDLSDVVLTLQWLYGGGPPPVVQEVYAREEADAAAGWEAPKL